MAICCISLPNKDLEERIEYGKGIFNPNILSIIFLSKSFFIKVSLMIG